MSSIGSAMSGSAPQTSSPSEIGGANTFSNLKGLFKQQYSTCKHCGKEFVPKMKTGIKNISDKQKEAIAISAAKGPKI